MRTGAEGPFVSHQGHGRSGRYRIAGFLEEFRIVFIYGNQIVVVLYLDNVSGIVMPVRPKRHCFPVPRYRYKDD